MRLRRYEKTPPGGFVYQQTEGIARKFGTSYDLYTDARTLQDFRAGNGLSRATFAACLQDIDEYTCLRLGGMPEFCHDPDVPYSQTQPKLRAKNRSCGTCGAKIRK